MTDGGIVRKLSPRERQIVLMLAQGRQQKSIAQELGISYNTVRAHLRSARRRTGTDSTLELAVQVCTDRSTDT